MAIIMGALALYASSKAKEDDAIVKVTSYTCAFPALTKKNPEQKGLQPRMSFSVSLKLLQALWSF